MRFIIWLFVLSISAVFAAWLMKNNSGHFVIFWNTHRLDMSLNTGLIVFVLLNIICFFFLRLINGLINLPLKAKAYRVRQRSLRAYTELAQAMEHYFAGRYIKAIRVAQFPTSVLDTASIAWMIIAQANHQLKNYELRNQALNKIEETQYQQAKLILQAQFLVDDRQPTAALQIIQQLQVRGARQFIVQSIAMRAHHLAKHWLEVVRLANNLKKRNYLNTLIARARIIEGLNQLLQSKEYTSAQLLKQWQELSTSDRENQSLMKLFAKGFIQVNDALNAKKMFDVGFESGLHSELILLLPAYSRIPGVNKNETVLLLEKFLKQDMANHYLHFSMGELCFDQHLWGKAIASFEMVISSVQVSDELKTMAHLRLFHIYEEIEDTTLSNTHQKILIQLLATKIHYE